MLAGSQEETIHPTGVSCILHWDREPCLHCDLDPIWTAPMHVRSYSSCRNLYLELNIWIYSITYLWTFFFGFKLTQQKGSFVMHVSNNLSPISCLSAQPRQQWLLVIRNGNGMLRVHVSWAGCWQLVGISSLLILTQCGCFFLGLFL